MKHVRMLCIPFALLVCFTVHSQRIPFFQSNSLLLEETSLYQSATHPESQTFLQTGSIFATGLFGGLRRFYAGGMVTFEAEQHGVGLTILRDERGEVLSETAVHALYRKGVPLSSRHFLLLGTQVGVYQAAVEASDVAPGDNDIGLNINVSTTIRTERWNTTVFFNNTTRPTLLLVQSQLVFPRTVGSITKVKVMARPQWESSTTLLLTHIYEALFVSAAWDHTLRQQFALGLNVSNRAAGLYGGVSALSLNKRKLKVLLGYQLPISQDALSSLTRFQIHLALF